MFKALPALAEVQDNTITPEKVTLGRQLYFDNRLSKTQTQNCNTCHNLETYGVDHKPLSPGDDGGLGERNSPTVYNSALNFAQFWDGRAMDVEEQAGMPVLNPVEMAMPDEDFVIDRLKDVEEYQVLFADAFPDDANPLTFENMKKAIGAFERTLITPSRFDKYLNGDPGALTVEEKKGLNTFMEVGCTTCHTGVLIGGNMFQKFGVHFNYWEYTHSDPVDEGRAKETGNETDKYMFRVPTMRNVAETQPYFHDGSVASLEEAVKIISKVNLNRDLTDEEVSNILLFLKTLTGEIPETARTPEKI